MAEELTGVCRFCGQTRMIPRDIAILSQDAADRYAAEHCACDNNLKKCRQLSENIDQLCGEECKQYGMDILEENTIDTLKEVGNLCVYGYINSAGFAIKGTSITIKQIKDGVSVSRKKVSSVKLEA